MPRSRSSALEPEAEAAQSAGRMSRSAVGESTPAKGAAWVQGVALGNVASSPVDSAAGLDWRPVRGERTVTPSSKALSHLLSLFILTAALGSLDDEAPILQVRELSLRESHRMVALS